MIIDLILERREREQYDAGDFYREVMEYGEIGWGIASAMDGGEEHDVKRELIRYVVEHNYNLNICGYILSVDWL